MTTSDRREHQDYAKPDTPGLYKMTREVVVDGRWCRNEMICRNPAFGRRVLDSWEEAVRRRIPEPVVTSASDVYQKMCDNAVAARGRGPLKRARRSA